MMFYRPDGTEIDKDSFLSLYSGDYFISKTTVSVVPRLSRCSEYIERTIETIRIDGIGCERDVARLLAWKIGKIKHRESEDSQRFIYSSDWKNADSLEGVKLYNKDFDIGKIASYITNHRQELERLAENNPQDFLNRINEQKFERIGTVYMITLLYFLSHGKYPIYDRFAAMALNAIEGNMQPKYKEKIGIAYTEIPDKSSKLFPTVMSDGMKDYMEKILNIFGNDYQNNRRVDQALWVYGHLFTKQKSQT